MSEICLDSSILISIADRTIQKNAMDLLEQNSPAISIIAYAELARYFIKKGGIKIWEDVQGQLEAFRVISLDTETCQLSAETSQKHALAFADSLIYSCAIRNGMKLLTKDSDFRGLKGAIVV